MNIAIIDDMKTDCQLAAHHLQTYFSIHCLNLPLQIRSFESGEIFLHTFTRSAYDFIFIDYYMSGMSGLETAKRIRDIDSSVLLIFNTTSRDYAIDSFKVKASGYLVKPLSYEALSDILSLIDLEQVKDQQFIEITSGYEQIRILIKDIIYCDICGHYIQLHTQSGVLHRMRMTFEKLLVMLKPYEEFLLCYRGCLINMNHVNHIDNMNFFMNGGDRIPLRQKEKDQILKAYSEFLFEKVRHSKS